MRAVVAVSVWLATAAAAAYAQSPSKDVRVAIVGDTALVIFGDSTGSPLDLDPFSHAGVITNATILFAQRDGVFYLYESYSENRSFVAVSDHANPGAGLSVTSEPLKQD